MEKTKRWLFLSLFIILLTSFATATLYPLDVPRTLESSSDGNYAFENQNRFFQVWYGNDPSTGNVVKFISGGVEMTLLPQALNYNNDLSQLEQISMPQSVSGVVSGTDIIYTNAYGTDIDLIYQTTQNQVKEKIIIQQASALPTPAQYVIDGGNPMIEVGFQLASEGKIFLDGVEWDKASEISTTDDVLVKDANDNLVYTLPRPYATDSNLNTVFGSYVFKKSANKLYVRMYLPYSWLNDTTRVYPVTIDPTFSVDYSPIPAQHLIEGLTDREPDFAFTQIKDITAGVSDLDDNSNYEIIWNEVIDNSNLATMFKFEETSGSTVQDLGMFRVDMELFNSPDLSVGGVSGSGISFDGIDDFGIINRTANINSTDDIIICLSMKDSGIGAVETIYDNKGGGTAQGVELELLGSDVFNFFIRRGSTQTTLSSTTSLDDDIWHTLCSTSFSNGTVELHVDGVIEDSDTGVTGAMSPTEIIHVAESHTGGSLYSQSLDEICTWRGVDLDEDLIISSYNDTYCGNPDGIAITGSWNQTYDSTKEWFLRIRKTTSGITSIFVYAYDDENNVSDTQFVTNLIAGVGWRNVNISSLMDYETNTLGFNYTQLRFYTDVSHNFSEVFLRSEVNDTVPPSVNSCWTPTPIVGCDGTAYWVCDITDDSDVDYVNFTIDGTNVSATMNNSEWFYALPFSDLSSVNETITMTDVFAFDIFDQEQHNSTSIGINHVCDFNAVLSAGHFHKEAFNVSETFYLPKLIEEFNTTLATDIVALTSFNTQRLSGSGTVEVWARALIDGDLLTEEKIRTVTGTDEGVTGLNPLKFSVASGSHNFTVEFKLIGDNGTVEINDIDVVTLAFLSAGVPIRNEIVNVSYTHSDTSYIDAFNFTIPNTFNSRTYMVIKQNVEATGTTVGEYTIRNRDTDVKSPYNLRYIPTVNATGSMSFAYFDEQLALQPDYSIYSKSTTGQTINATGKIFNVDLKDDNEESIPAWQVSNNLTNLTNTQTYGVGSHLLMESTQPLFNGDSMFITMSISFSSTTGEQTPTFVVNSSTLVFDCYSKKERYLSGSSDIGNAYIFTLCSNMTALSNYTYQTWLEVESGETVEVYDEVMIGIETAEFVIVSTCLEVWQQDSVSCLTNDTGLVTYTDLNSCGSSFLLPPNNGTFESCNFCSEDVQQVVGECQATNEQNVSYIDGNYSSCCAVTGFASDCSVDVLPPFNETSTQFCHFFSAELGVPICQEQFDFSTEEKEYCLIFIPSNFTNESFKCMDYIVSDVPAEIIQTNPEYRERAQGVFDFWRGAPESREFFEPANGMVNMYITRKNLQPENDYFIHFVCSSDQRTLESVHPFSIGYANFEGVFYRLRWGIANAQYLIPAIIVIFILLSLLFILWRNATK